MHGLVVPLPATGFVVERDEAFAEKRVAGTITAVIGARRHFHSDVDETELGVGAHLRPRTGVATVFGRTFEPGVVPRLTWPWNRVKDPQPLACAYVVASHVAFRVAHGARRCTGSVRSADDDDVANNERRGVQTHFGRVEVDVLIIFELQIDDAV